MDGWPHINRLVARECMWTDSGVRWQRCVREVRQARAEARATLWYVQPAYAAIQRHQRRGGVKMRPRPLPRRAQHQNEQIHGRSNLSLGELSFITTHNRLRLSLHSR